MSAPFVVPTIPDAPKNLKDHAKAMVRKLYQVIDQNVDEAKESADVVRTYQAALNKSRTLLATDDRAADYRKVATQEDLRIKEYQKEYEEAIAPFAKRLDEQKAAAKAVTREEEIKAMKAIGLESGVSEKEHMEALENYKAAAEMISMVVAKLKKQGVDTSFSLPTIDPKGGKKTGETRGFTPRFSKVVIGNTELTTAPGKTPKLTDIVNKIGVASIDREFILNQLPNKEAWELLDPGQDVSIVLKWTDLNDESKSVEFPVTVTKAQAPVRAVKNQDGSLTEAPDDDDDDDDDDDESSS